MILDILHADDTQSFLLTYLGTSVSINQTHALLCFLIKWTSRPLRLDLITSTPVKNKDGSPAADSGVDINN